MKSSIMQSAMQSQNAGTAQDQQGRTSVTVKTRLAETTRAFASHRNIDNQGPPDHPGKHTVFKPTFLGLKKGFAIFRQSPKGVGREGSGKMRHDRTLFVGVRLELPR
eukprot:2035670-Amphidinium_carterae.1